MTTTELADEPTADAGPPGPPPAPAPRPRLVGLLGRYWATALLVLGVLVAGLSTGALWTPVVEGTALFDRVAYGLPALREGRVWTFFTGMFFAPELALYVPILVLLVIAACAYERRAGHVRTLVVALGGHFLAGLLTALALWPFADSGWTWAAGLGSRLDLGISAGGFALVGALTASMSPVWRVRFRVCLGAYLIAMVVRSGLLWDVEHLVAFGLGVFAGPLLAGARPKLRRFRFDRRAQRALVALIVAVTAISSLVEGVFPGNGGPFHGPIDDPEASTALSLSFVITAVLYLLAADGLRRGRRLAWAFVLVIQLLGLALAIGAVPSAERVANLAITGAQVLLLLVTWRAFSARTRLRAFRRAGRRLAVVALALFAYTAAGFAVLQDDFSPDPTGADMITEFLHRLVFTTSDNLEPTTTAARWFLGSIAAVWLAAILVTVIGLLYSSRRAPVEPDQGERLRQLLAEHSGSNIAWMLTWDDIRVWFDDDRGTAVGFVLVGSVALCLGDPVGPPEHRLATLRAFDDHCFERGWIPCLFAASQECAELAPELRWKAVQVAEDSVMLLEGLEFKGKRWQDVRTAINKAGKSEISFETTTWGESTPVVTDQLRVISQGWVGEKALPEMGFTLGTIKEAQDPAVQLALAVDEDRTIEGFLSWMPVTDGGQTVGWTLDLMRKRDQGFRQVMEYLIGSSALHYQEQGYQFLSLSAAPLARAPESADEGGDQKVLQKLLDFLGDTLEPYYGFKSLFAFKQKFQPVHHPMYLVFPDSSALAEIGLAVARAYVPSATLGDWVRMGWEMVGPSAEADEGTPSGATAGS
jgi:phosphatidylglycerol lysyltransferase